MIYALVFASLFAASTDICLRKRTVIIPEESVAVIGAIDDLKTNKLVLHIPIDCKSGRSIVPATEEQALAFLDLALPLDLKSSASQGVGSIPPGSYPYTKYKGSADYFALKIIGKIWSQGGFCAAYKISEPELSDSACTIYLYGEFRRQFMPRKPWGTYVYDMNKGLPSTPPTIEELNQLAADADKNICQKDCKPK